MKIEGANAPPTPLTKPQKRGQSRVSTAWVWPGGHTRGVQLPSLAIFFYILLNFLFQLLDLTKPSLIFGFNQLICEDLF